MKENEEEDSYDSQNFSSTDDTADYGACNGSTITWCGCPRSRLRYILRDGLRWRRGCVSRDDLAVLEEESIALLAALCGIRIDSRVSDPTAIRTVIIRSNPFSCCRDLPSQSMQHRQLTKPNWHLRTSLTDSSGRNTHTAGTFPALVGARGPKCPSGWT